MPKKKEDVYGMIVFLIILFAVILIEVAERLFNYFVSSQLYNYFFG